MDKTKLFHYVPQFYLKSFAIPDKKDMIWCFDKLTSKTFITEIRKIGCEKDFYDQDVEKYLSNLESQISPVYRKLVSTGDLGKLNWAERVSLAIFVAIQDSRTQELRTTIQAATKEIMDRFIIPSLSKSEIKASNEIIKKYVNIKSKSLAKDCQIDLLKQSIDLFAEMLLGLQWILLQNKTNMPLWTADNPVNKFNPIKAPPHMGNLGYLSPGIEIFFPLSPKLCLCFCDIGLHGLVPLEKMSMHSTENIIYQNHLLLSWSNRHIFSQQNDFALAEKMLQEPPLFRKPYDEQM